jgi:D-glycero-alpha-D-manno-heptose-7-phosphate kinase
MACTIVTYVDAPAGSGLGSSSTLVTAMLGAFNEWLDLALGEYELARLAFEVERVDLGMAGGKQDQYAATFGGFNFMEFSAGDKVIVNPLRIRPDYLHELEACLLFYYTGQSRLSSTIIQAQIDNVQAGDQASIQAMHLLKDQAVQLKEALLTGRMSRIGEILDFGWRSKKNMAKGISNSLIDKIYETAIQAGATGGKVSGAGGGGHMILFCPGVARYGVEHALTPFGGEFKRLQFVEHGLHAWRAH